MVDERVRGAALDLLYQMIADGEQEEWENAESFIALTTNDETKYIHINGTFPDAATALAWAEQHETGLNRGAPPEEAPFVVTVFPVQAPS